MRKLLFWIMLVILVSLVLAAAATGQESRPRHGRPAAVSDVSDGPNLLANPSFEGPYSTYVPPPPGHPDCNYGPCTTAQMAAGWTPWWVKPRGTDVNPEFKAAESYFTDPVRVRTGDRAQQYFSFSSTHEAGIYQQVAVTAGEPYCFNIWGHSWSAQDDDDAYSGPAAGWLDQKVGVDPGGGTDPLSENVKWGPPRLQYDEYGQFGVCAYAQTNQFTVFTYSRPIYPVKHNDVYWDDAELFSPDLSSGLVVVPANGLNFEIEKESSATITRTVTVEMPDVLGLIWTVESDTSGGLNFDFSPSRGNPNDLIAVTVDTTGYSAGTYSGQITIQSDIPMPGSPAVVPVTLVVRGLEHSLFLAAVQKD